MDELITRIVLDNIPREFEDRKNWGHRVEIWSGLSVHREGLKIRTHGKQREVNHGTWEYYRVRLIDPEQHFHVHVENLRELADGRVAFHAWVEAQLSSFGQVIEWSHGVELFSLSADAEARVRLAVECELGMRLDPRKLPPDVLFDPVIRDAKLELLDFRLRRISDFHGPVVKELGRGVRRIIEDKLEAQRPKLVQKINRQIQSHRDSIRLSLHDVLASKWGQLATQRFQPDSGKPQPAADRQPETPGS